MAELKSFQIVHEEGVFKVYYTFLKAKELMYVARTLDSALQWIRQENGLDEPS